MPGYSSAPDGRLKIGLVVDDSLDRPDGVQQYVLTLGVWLGSRGHDVHYISSRTDRTDIPSLHVLTDNVPVRFNGNRFRIPLLASRGEIWQLLRREQFDVLHIQMPYSPLMAGRVVAAASAKTAVVGTFHVMPRTWLASLGSRLLAAWCRKTLRRFAAVVSVSDAAQEFAGRAFGLESTVVPNAVNLMHFSDAKPFPRKSSDPLHILFLGRLVPRKGCMTLLQATRLLADNAATPPFSVTICGTGPLELELRRYATMQGLTDKVHFMGFVSEADKPRYYASADLTVFPSYGGESFGIVLPEAMASGRAAVLAGDNAGYRFVLGDCPGEVLFNPHDPKALADRMASLMDDTAKRRHIAAWQQHHARLFDIERVGHDVERLYRSALRQQRSMR